MDEATLRLVRARALQRCEYCHLPQAGHDQRFSIDHVIPRKHGGTDASVNLALACLRCNLAKGPNLSGIDPASGQIVTLFNPRTHVWNEHFSFSQALVIGVTAIGRATVQVMAMNAPERLMLRRALMAEGIFDPGVGR